MQSVTVGQHTLIDWPQSRAATNPLDIAYIYLADGEEREESLTYGGLDLRARTIGAALQASQAVNQPVLLLFPPGLDYICGFVGCLYAGAIAVPSYPPRFNRTLSRLQAIITDSGARFILTTAAIRDKARSFFEQAPTLRALKWIAVDELDEELASRWNRPEVDSDSLAFLQYTSGSTSAPRGVMVSHGNLIENERCIERAFDQSAESVVVSWLPLYHDMGLIGGVLQPLYLGARCILLSPASFLQRPIRWLQAISRYRATTSGGPNFAYDLCVRRTTPEQRAALDLSTWSVAFNGAEPIRERTIARFAQAFEAAGFRPEAMHPCYGLAEATLLVSAKAPGKPPLIREFDVDGLESHRADDPHPDAGQSERSTKRLVGCGASLPRHNIVIVNPETLSRCAPGAVGEIWVSGPSVAQGYWKRPTETMDTFGACVSETGEGPFLRTGDLGFIKDGELFVTGRLKDLIVIRGVNYYPHDIEMVVEQSHAALRPGHCAAFSIESEGDEQLVIVQEVEAGRDLDYDSIIEDVRLAVSDAFELRVHAVALIRAGSIPKTSSGKIQRHLCRKAFLDGDLQAIAEARFSNSLPLTPGASRKPVSNSILRSVEGIEVWLAVNVASMLGLNPLEIDVNQPLARYGLDSLTTLELTHFIESNLGVHIKLSDLSAPPSIAQLAVLIQTRIGASARPTEAAPVEQPPVGAPFPPLSYGQRALWFLHQVAPESAAYNIANAVKIKSEIDLSCLRRAFRALIDRHSALRTTFVTIEGQPRQRVREHAEPFFICEDASGWSEAELNERLAKEALRPFDLENGPLMRAFLFSRSEREHALLITIHHIVADFWSLAILIHELGLFYNAEISNATPRIEPLQLQYAEYARRQTEMLAGEQGRRLWEYWSNQLAGDLQPLALPTDNPRPAIQSYKGSAELFKLNPRLANEIKAFSQSNGVTLYVTLLAAFQILLHRYANQELIIVGSPMAGRGGADVAGLVGYFVNPVALKADFSGDPQVRDFLFQTQATVSGAFAHQEYPFPLLVERLRAEWDPSRSPIFQVMFAFQKSHLLDEQWLAAYALGEAGLQIELQGLSLESMALQHQVAQFDLTMMAAESEGAVLVSIQYNVDLFKRETVRRMGAHYERLLEEMLLYPERRISDLEYLTRAEKRLLIEDWNRTAIPYETEKTIHELVSEQAWIRPDDEAVICGRERLSYRELEERSNRLARYLVKKGVKTESLVGACLERGVEMVVALLGILKAGGAYAPMDPSYPAERLAYMVEDAGMKLVVSQRSVKERLPGEAWRGEAEVVCLDEEREEIEKESRERMERRAGPENLAYVIYTSGSTGKPKGLGVEHRSLLNLVYWHNRAYQVTPDDRATQVASPGFDASVWEIWPYLAAGASLYIADEEIRAEPDRLRDWMVAEGVTVCFMPTPLAESAIGRKWSEESRLRYLLTGGDRLRVRPSPDNSFKLVNHYGPTENTVVASSCVVEAVDENGRAPAIGRPISNVQIYILDERGRPQPVGAIGELCISGEGLARGYLNRPELTAEKFTPNPFSKQPGQRLYRTGDLCRYLPDGEIEFIGRKDHQIKLRGYRIELGEIEAALNEQPEVLQSVVTVRENEAGDRRLVGYVVYEEGAQRVGGRQLRERLKERLPEYMRPAAIVELEEMPLTANGKVDRRRLPEPVEEECGGEPMMSPVEEVLGGIWAGALGRERVGRNENFFEAGGHSLLATQMISRVREVFGVELGVRSLFEAPTIERFAERIEAELKGSRRQRQRIVRAERPAGVRKEIASPGQRRLYFMEQMEPGSRVFHMSGAVRLKGPVNLWALERSFNEIVRRHETLRTNFEMEQGEVLQVIGEGGIGLELTDLSGLGAGHREEEARRVMQEEAARAFDLEKGRLFRVRAIRLGEEEHILQMSMHHIVGDGWSMGVLVRELGHLYERYSRGEESDLEELEIQYSDYARWEREGEREEEQAREVEWWRRELEGVEDVEMPADRARPARQSYRGRQEKFEIGRELSGKLKELSVREAATLYMVMLAGLEALVNRYTNQEEYVIGSLVANRERRELEGLIGFLVNAVGIRADVRGNPSVRELIRRVRERALEAYAHQGAPFEKVVEALGVARDLSRSPVYQIVFNMQNTPVSRLELSGLLVEPIETVVEATPVDLTFSVREEDGLIQGSVEYAEFFAEDSIRRLIAHYRRALEEIVRDPEQRISEINLLTEVERRRIVEEWNLTDEAFPLEYCYHQLFERQAKRTPDRIAVVCGERRLTYRELNEQANRLARILSREGVGPEAVVPLLSTRRIEMLVAILAIFKAGGAYLPLDPAYPPNRIRQIVEQSRPGLALASDDLASDFERAISTLDLESRPRTLHLDRLLDQDEDEGDLPPRAAPSNLAYVIYTSGSTGAPKGAMVEQIGMLNHLYSKLSELRLTENDAVAQTASQCFDISVWQFLAALLVGGRTHIFDDNVTHDPSELLRQIERESISIVEVVPSLLRAMLEEAPAKADASAGFSALRFMIVTGEALPPELVSRWLDIYPRVPMVNAYGPTECSDDVTHMVIATPLPSSAPRAPIGRPISNMRLYALDKTGQPAPIGVGGELHVGGIGVGRGYLNDPARTAQAFTPDPFSGQPGARLYKTGDLVCYRPNGDIEFLGRIDEQVKVRGFRIELGEIEAVLAQHPFVKQAVVVAREDRLGDKRLIGYVVPKDRCGEGESTAEFNTEQVSQWQIVFDSVYAKTSESQNVTLNLSGWDSSYTGEPIPEEAMREWIEHTVAKILALKPTRALELGCGAGLLVERISPHCAKYWGTDFAPESLRFLRQRLDGFGKSSEIVLLEREADNFDGIEPGAFDAVIINSVAQYFPGIDYLLRVIERAISVIQPGGFIYIGDVRNLALLKAFHLSVQLYKAEPETTRAELRRRVDLGISNERELAIDPGFFYELKRRLPGIVDAQIQLKRGRHHNELTRFRYDALLRIGRGSYPDVERWSFDWNRQSLDLHRVRRFLERESPGLLSVSCVPNARLRLETQALAWLDQTDGPDTVGEFLESVQTGENLTVDPEDFWALEKELPYSVEINGAGYGSQGYYDVVFRHNSAAWMNHGGSDRISAQNSHNGQSARPWREYANDPLKEILASNLASQLRTYLKDRLPEYMTPGAFVILDSLPQTRNGKVDRRALPEVGAIKPDRESVCLPARTPTEEVISEIWKQVLDIAPIGVRDKFFDIGGDSLKLVRVFRLLGERYPNTVNVVDLFKHVTIEALAAHIDAARSGAHSNGSGVPALQGFEL